MEEEATIVGIIPRHDVRKRTHAQMMEGDRDFLSSWINSSPEPTTHNPPTAPSTSTFEDNNNNFPQHRYTGDGYDYRRPIMSQPPNCVIDLTTEPDSPPQSHSRADVSDPVSTRASRPPRFARDIINIDDDDEEIGWSPESQSRLEGGGSPDGSPDVEILWSAPVLPSQRTQVLHGLQAVLPRPHTSRATPGLNINAPEASQRDRPFGNLIRRWSQFFPGSASARGYWNSEERRGPAMSDLDIFTGDVSHAVAPILPDSRARRHRSFARGSGTLAIDLNFETQAFPLGNEINNDPSPPTYNAPPPSRPGFTRSPEEDDVVVCPNCDEELGTGDDEVKRQVWIIKSCGHVYCGNCAKFRFKTKTKQVRPVLSQPFTHCVVEDCGQLRISQAKAMFQVYI